MLLIKNKTIIIRKKKGVKRIKKACITKIRLNDKAIGKGFFIPSFLVVCVFNECFLMILN